MNLTITEQLAYSTIRIVCLTENGIQTGTGFLFKFLENGEQHVPVIVTNKHVVQGGTEGVFVFTKSDSEGNPISKDHFKVTIRDFEQFWRFHPDDDIDLCAMPLAQVVNGAAEQKVKLFYRTFERSLLPNDEQKNDLQAVEDILMIGYPNGIWDEVNNQPIFRSGTTATHPNMDYNGRKEFMIDVACFPGSSGSPS